MKRKHIILFFIFFASVYMIKAQTYRVQVTYSASSDNCHAGSFDWTFKAGGSTIDSYSIGGNSFGNVGETRTYTVGNVQSLSLTLNAGCIPLGSATLDCSVNQTVTKTAAQLIVSPYLSVSSCNGNVRISFFKPNVTTSLLNGNTGEVCVGGQLSIGATAGFPIEAYNWQYSLNYQSSGSSATWQNFPSSFNSIPQVNITMQQLIGATHEQYINNNIHLRVGRGSRAFSSIRAIFYSACAPLVTALNYNPPNCTNDAISVTVNFDRPLDSNELFSQISIVDTANGSLIFEQQNNVLMDTPSGNTFTFTSVFGLEQGHSYFIEYQMKKDGVTVPGFIESAQTFTFNDATPVTFSAAWTHVNCYGDNTGSISITAAGGAGGYQYSINNGAGWSPFSGASTHIRTNLPAGTYTVKVKDANNCVAQQ